MNEPSEIDVARPHSHALGHCTAPTLRVSGDIGRAIPGELQSPRAHL